MLYAANGDKHAARKYLDSFLKSAEGDKRLEKQTGKAKDKLAQMRGRS
jgi:hypothetical protein